MYIPTYNVFLIHFFFSMSLGGGRSAAMNAAVESAIGQVKLLIHNNCFCDDYFLN